MTFLKTRFTKKIGKNNQSYKKVISEYSCDFCKSSFERGGKENSKYRYCDKSCQDQSRCRGTSTGDATRLKISKAANERFNDPIRGSLLREKHSISIKLAHQNDPTIGKRSKQTCILRHGKSALQLARKSFVEKYNVSSPGCLNHVKEIARANMKSLHSSGRLKQAFIDSMGVDNPWKSRVVQEKCKKTSFERFGVPNSFMLDETKKNSHSKESMQKRHQTMKKNGTYHTSNAEEFMYAILLNNYQHVVRQHKFPIGGLSDFYISSIQTYVQVDGDYWHGFNRTIEEVELFVTPRDRQIFVTMNNDLKQNEFFASRQTDFCLFRISESIIVKMKDQLEQITIAGIENAKLLGLNKIYV